MATAQALPSASSRPQPQQQPKRNWLADTQTKGTGLPSRIILHAVEKWGKTSWAAQIPGVLFGMPSEETGLQTLIDSGLIKETPFFPTWNTWEEVLDSVDYLTENDSPYKAFCIDTGNGIAGLCHDFISRRDYGGKFDKSGFLSYMQGYEASIPEWKILLAKLDKLREVKKIRPVILCHTKIEPFKNPAGADFDRYVPAMHRKMWEATHRWADVILFGKFETITDKQDGRAKGIGGQQRVICTVRHDAYDAGNRLGLTDEIDCGNSAPEAWANFVEACKAAKKGSN